MHTQTNIIRAAFPQQQWFRERASVLRYTYIACLVCNLTHLRCGYPTIGNETANDTESHRRKLESLYLSLVPRIECVEV